MPVANDTPLKSLSEKESGYRFSSAITEENSSTETYGVQFCLKPSQDHIRGGATTWRSQLSSEKTNGSNNHSLPPPPQHSQQDDTGNSTVDDCEISPVPTQNQDVSWRDVFITCTGIFIRVYEARKKRMPILLQTYADGDINEMFYSVAPTFNADGNREWWVCAAGNRGILRVINMQTARLIRSLTGHGEAINDIKIHPRDPALALTASRDESLRLWNLRSGVTVAMFAGLQGHRGQVLFADFDATGRRFVSCGIDNSIRIWDIDADYKLVEAIAESHEAADCGADDTYEYEDRHGNKRKMQARSSQFPYFVTTKVHNHYVDCVMWVGDLLLSKSVHNMMLLWEPGFDRDALGAPANNFSLLEEYTIEGCEVWFIRFGMDQRRRLVACGNDEGVIVIYDLATIPSEPLCEVWPKGSKPRKGKGPSRLVRQCAFSEDGKFLVAVDEHSNIMQYERK
eukprot:GFKZ01001179.1.p1 GENE.GFKZ01001179.1~~GFKZ01001179.1.p1  ORF type:complete len:455 (-),score=57.89 GFKZ01001179.1:1089-2453(-)